MNPIITLLMLVLLLALAIYVIFRVRSDYRTHGRLSGLVSIMQVVFFIGYLSASFAALSSDLAEINASGWWFPLALILMLAGFVGMIFALAALGSGSFGRKVGALRTSGVYRYSRNPQLVSGFLLAGGYALLWPSWTGALWVVLYLMIAHLMVLAEETHLENVHGQEYQDYRARTPRYFGLPKKIA